MTRAAAVALVALALMALMAAGPAEQAQAQAPEDSTTVSGRDPHVAVDSNGHAHLTWVQSNNGQDETLYCSVQAATTGCSNTTIFSYPPGPEQGLNSGAWPLLPRDGRVLVLDARCCTAYAAKFLYTSNDGGATFGPRTQIGEDNNSGADIRGHAQYVDAGSVGRPQESVLTFGSLATLGLSFQAMATTGPPERTSGNNVLTQGNAASGSFGLQRERLVAAWWSIDDRTVYWRAWSGSGDVNNAGNWTPLAPLAPGTDTRVAGGPGGIYLAYLSGGDRIVMHEFTGSGWGEAVTISDVGTSGPYDLVQAPDGGLHFVWLAANGEVRYRSSSAATPTTFSAARTVQDPNSFGFRNPRLGVGPGGERWLVWEDSNPSIVHARPLAAPPPPPTRGKTVNAVPVKGKVLVKLPRDAGGKPVRGAQSGFVPLESIGRQLPVGSILNTRRGTVRLTAATTSNGTKTQNGRFNGGLFSVDQGRKNPLTTISMRGGGLDACSRLPRGGARKAQVTEARRRRRVFGNVRGRFRTRGRNSVATVRGTRWSMTDSCRGTLTRVTQGSVIVRDLALRRNRRLRAGQSYLAKPPRR